MAGKQQSSQGNGLATLSPGPLASGSETLPVARCLEIHRIMVRARAMEERMIKMSKSGEGYFWIGGPGEEAFNTCLGLQVKKGEGPDYDYLHLHYRNSATLVCRTWRKWRRKLARYDERTCTRLVVQRSQTAP